MGALGSGLGLRRALSFLDEEVSLRRLTRAFRRAGAASLVVAVAGCTVVSSVTHLGPETERKTAFAYMLPKALLPIQLLELRGNFIINAGAPVYVGDARHTYYATYNNSPLSLDTVDVTIDPNGLLRAVNVTADDKTGEFLISLAKSYGAIKSFGKESSLVGAAKIAEVQIDPDDPYSISAGENAIAAAINIRISAGIRENCGPNAKTDDNKQLCGIYRSLRASRPSVKLTAFAPNLVPQATLPDCSIGVCYRLPVPYRVSAGFKFGKDVAVSSVIVPLPNGGPIVATNFARAPFVKKVTNAGFTNGMLTSLHIEKPSEAVAVALLPVEIIKALFSSIAETFTSRQSALKAELAYISALKEIEGVKSSKESSIQEADTSIMSVSLGVSQRQRPDSIDQARQNASGKTNTANTGQQEEKDKDTSDDAYTESTEDCTQGNCKIE